jgi:putative ABC transport system permease protein
MAFAKFVGETLVFKVTALSFFRVLSLAMVGGVLSLSPLIWGALQIPVSIVFKDLPAEISKINKIYFLPFLIYVICLAVILSHSYKLGFIFIGAVFVLVILSGIIFKIFSTILERVARNFKVEFKQAIYMMSRYFTSTFTIFICLLIGMTLTVFIMQIDQSLRNEFTSSDEKRRPDVFMFDLQDADYEEFNKQATDNHFKITMMSPMIRARLLSINGEKTSERIEVGENNFQTREEQSSNQMRNRGVNLSYRKELSWSETIVEGKFNGNDCHTDICEVSLEQSYARRIKAKLNDILLFDISGIEVKGKVTSLRSVKWTSFEPNFFILFQPNVINDAPKTFLASFKVNDSKEKQVIFKVMAKYFPSVSLLDLSEVVGRVIKVFNLMAQAIKIISILSLIAALIVLMSVSFNHMDIRKKEMSLFYMLGLGKNIIFKIFNIEFIFIILICTLLSLFFGSSLTYIVMKYGFNSTAQYLFGEILLILFSIVLLLFIIFILRMKYLLNNLLFFR